MSYFTVIVIAATPKAVREILVNDKQVRWTVFGNIEFFRRYQRMGMGCAAVIMYGKNISLREPKILEILHLISQVFIAIQSETIPGSINWMAKNDKDSVRKNRKFWTENNALLNADGL